MTKVWVGYSEVLGFRDLIVDYIDPYFGPVDDNEEPVGRFERLFGAARSQPGSFEVYEKTSENDDVFGYKYVLDSFPFSDRPSGLGGIDWRQVKTVFFMENTETPKMSTDGQVTITDVMNVTFDWERPRR